MEIAFVQVPTPKLQSAVQYGTLRSPFGNNCTVHSLPTRGASLRHTMFQKSNVSKLSVQVRTFYNLKLNNEVQPPIQTSSLCRNSHMPHLLQTMGNCGN